MVSIKFYRAKLEETLSSNKKMARYAKFLTYTTAETCAQNVLLVLQWYNEISIRVDNEGLLKLS